LTNGKQFKKRVRFPKGDPENPLSWQKLSTKFLSLAVRALPEKRCEQLVNSVKDMNASTKLRDIWNLASRPAN